LTCSTQIQTGHSQLNDFLDKELGMSITIEETIPTRVGGIDDPNANGKHGDGSGVRRHRVAIVGSGFGGLFAAKALRHADVEVTVIDRTNHHLFQPLLYQVAAGILSEGDIASPIRDILRKQFNTSVVLGEVVDVDIDTRRLVVDTVGRRSEIAYDSLIVATGASQSYFGHPEFAEDAPGMKTIDDALELRGRIFGAFEMAEREPDPAARRHWLTFVVVGAGPTGVEIAGQIAELSRRSLHRNFRRINPAEARIVLLDSGHGILKSFLEALRARAARDLQHMGVEIHSGTKVTGVDENGIHTNSADAQLARTEAATKFWAAGVQASPLGRLLAEAASVEVDRAGRVKVEPDCTLPGHPEVFVIGDLMSLDNLPGLAQVAIQSGRYAAKAVPLPRPWDAGNDLAPTRDRSAWPSSRFGFPGMAALAGHPHRGANRLQESSPFS
jgi:NADH dehydrogenase